MNFSCYLICDRFKLKSPTIVAYFLAVNRDRLAFVVNDRLHTSQWYILAVDFTDAYHVSSPWIMNSSSNNLTYSPRWVHSIWGVVGVPRKWFGILSHHQRKCVIEVRPVKKNIYITSSSSSSASSLSVPVALQMRYLFNCISHCFIRFIIIFLQLSLGFQDLIFHG